MLRILSLFLYSMNHSLFSIFLSCPQKRKRVHCVCTNDHFTASMGTNDRLDLQSEISTISSHHGLSFWQFMMAGSIAGCVEHMAMFPIDTLKTRMQAITNGSNPLGTRPIGVREVLVKILRSEGPAGLYGGVTAMGLVAGPAHAVYFSVYELCKRAITTNSSDPNNNHVAHAVSGIVATVASDAVINPMDVVKQRLQLKGSPYKGVGDCVRRVAMEEGTWEFYSSYRTTVIMNAPFTAVHFTTYEAAKRALFEISPEKTDDGKVVVRVTAGAAAGALAAVVTTPLDVVKTRLQCQVSNLNPKG